MSRTELRESVAKMHEEMDERLKDLSKEEQQQYLEGLVHACDMYTRLADAGELTPFDREEFMGNLKSWAYSKTTQLGLDTEKYMKPTIDKDGEHVAKSYLAAVNVMEALGMPLDPQQVMDLQNVLMCVEISPTG